MNVYGEFKRMAKLHIADINECEVLTDDIVKSARTFISNCIKWDSGTYRPVVDALKDRLLHDIYNAEYKSEYWSKYLSSPINSCEYENTIIHHESDKKAKELVDELEDKDISELYKVWKGCEHD